MSQKSVIRACRWPETVAVPHGSSPHPPRPQREIERENRRRTRGIVVAFVDVDGLKRTNDTLGHAAGDQLLCNVVQSIRARIRSYDLLFRYGGDEFVVGLLDVDMDQADTILSDIRHDVVKRTK